MCLACEAKESPETVDFTITELYCCTKVTGIPKEFTQLTQLSCSNCPLLTSIPREFTQLTTLDCYNCPLLTSIPKEFTQLTELLCYDCPLLTSIPKEFTQLTELYCWDCPLLTFSDKVKFTFMSVKKQYLEEEIRYKLETVHNESYYAPDGLGARELFNKYRNGIKIEN